MELKSTPTCPECGHREVELMPETPAYTSMIARAVVRF